MNASAVKPALASSGVQPPKVVLGTPPASTLSPPAQSAVSPPKPPPPNVSVSPSPVKPPTPVNVGLNHSPNAPLAPSAPGPEHRPPVTVNQQLLRPEKKEYPFSPTVAPPAVKPTSNGVEGSPSKPSAAIPAVLPPPQASEVKKPEEKVPEAVVNHGPEPVPTPPQPAAPLLPSLPSPAAVTAPVIPPVAVPSSPAKQDPVTANHTTSASETLVEAKPAVLPPATVEPVIPPPAPVTPPSAATAAEPPQKPAATEAVAKLRAEAAAKPEFKVATPPRNVKRKKEAKEAADDAKASTSDEDERKSKRTRTRTQPYQSPNPELTFIAKTIKTLSKSPDDKLIVFYKNEFLAVRNSEGGFYICQAVQNIYKSSPRIRIRWLSLEKQDSKTSDVYTPDFYDQTDFDCILTNLDLKKMDKNRFQLPAEERERTQNILKRALDVEKGVSEKSPVTEEHPDGLDLSLFRDESQLKKRKKKKGSKKGVKKTKAGTSESESDEDESDEDEEDSSESEDEEKKAVKAVKRIDTPQRAPARGKAKPKEAAIREVAKRAAPVSDREKRASTSKRKAEPLPSAAAAPPSTARTVRPPPEKKAKVAVKTPAKKAVEPAVEAPTRSAKTRGVKGAAAAPAAAAAKSAAAPTRGGARKAAAPAAKSGRTRPGKKA